MLGYPKFVMKKQVVFLFIVQRNVCLPWIFRYDAKVRATHERMKELGLLSPDYSHCLTLDEWEIPRKNVVLNRKLGEGAFGTVCGGEMFSEDEGWVAVAVKTLKIRHSMEEKVSDCDIYILWGGHLFFNIWRENNWVLCSVKAVFIQTRNL